MNTPMLGIMVPIVLFTGLFAMIFGIYYLRNRERMAMIERGMDPLRQQERNPNSILTWGLLLVGSGLGLFLAYMLDNTLAFAKDPDNPSLYFALVAVFGGAGLFLAYHIQRKENRRLNGE